MLYKIQNIHNVSYFINLSMIDFLIFLTSGEWIMIIMKGLIAAGKKKRKWVYGIPAMYMCVGA